MKKSIAGLLLAAVLLAGCASKTQNGTAAAGVVAGGVTDEGKGVLSRSDLDASSGLIKGSPLDEQDRKIMEKTSPRTIDRMDRNEPLTTNDIIKLSQAGINDEIIIRYIRGTNTTYNLSQTQLRRLQQAGVSQRIINFMVETIHY